MKKVKSAKYFIDYEQKIRECGTCKKIKPFSEFYLTTYETPMSYCKECYTKTTNNREKNKVHAARSL